MSFSRAFVLLVLVVACLFAGCAFASQYALDSEQQDGGLHSRSRQLLQLQNSDTSLKYADFSMIPADIAENNTVGEKALQGNITITTNAINQPYDVPFGTFYLGPTEVEQIIVAVTTQLNKVPVAQAETFVVRPQTRIIAGKSVLGNGGLRVPTIFAPEYAGRKFRVEGVEQPPGTILELRNMTIVMPDVTFDAGATMNLQGSSVMDYFEIGTSARVCFLNSMLVMKSCQGFAHDSFHVVCCFARTCITYTQAAYSELGNSQGPFDLLSCHEPVQEVVQDVEETSGATLQVMWQGITVHVAAALFLLFLT